MALLIKGASFVIRDSRRVERDVDILIDGERIRFIGRLEEGGPPLGAPCRVLSGKGKIVMPGLVNAHSHLYQNLLKGMRDDLRLADWCREVTFPLCEEVLQRLWQQNDDQMGYYWTMLASVEMIRSGVTTVIDLDLSMDSVFRAWHDIGFRGVGAITLADRWIPPSITKPPEAVREEVRRFVEQWHCRPASAPLTYVMLGPSAPFVCTRELLTWAREEAYRKGLRIHTHIAETKQEVEDVTRETGLRPVEYMDSIGLLDSDVSAAHCVHLTPEEMDILARRGVTAVHNPKSNMKLASGIAAVTALLTKGVAVALGTDGAASNDLLDMFEEMRVAVLLQKVANDDPEAMDAAAALDMATAGGAKACGLDVGVLDEGKLADVIILSTDGAHLLPLGDVVNTVVYCAKSSDVETVIINGRLVMHERKILTVDEEALLAEIRTAAEHLLRRVAWSNPGFAAGAAWRD